MESELPLAQLLRTRGKGLGRSSQATVTCFEALPLGLVITAFVAFGGRIPSAESLLVLFTLLTVGNGTDAAQEVGLLIAFAIRLRSLTAIFAI